MMFQIHDKVWALVNGKAVERVIMGSFVDDANIEHAIVISTEEPVVVSSGIHVQLVFLADDKMFTTKESLIASL